MFTLLVSLAVNANKAIKAGTVACKTSKNPTPESITPAMLATLATWNPEYRGARILSPALRVQLVGALAGLTHALFVAGSDELPDLARTAEKAIKAGLAEAKTQRTPTPPAITPAVLVAVKDWRPEVRSRQIVTPSLRAMLAAALAGLAYNLWAAENGKAVV